MKRAPHKSHCPINHALETIGDPWSLLILRDIAFWGKHSFREFLHSEEGIASNILAARLAHLTSVGILKKTPHISDRRKTQYHLTEKGVGFVPTLLELSGWGEQYDPQTTAQREFAAAVRADRSHMIVLAQDVVRQGKPLLGKNNIFLSRA